MPTKPPELRAALDEQDAVLTGLFEARGYAYVAPDILQPADVFLDRSGEDLRTRTYVFSDLEGHQLCLRPDITIPVCRHFLEYGGGSGEEARYCYAGPVFRFQPGGDAAIKPREFEQAGIELFGATDRERAEAETLALAIEAVEAVGLSGYSVQLGDLGLFDALLAGIDMPGRWRARLHHHFWRPQAFRDLLARLTGSKPETHPLASRLSGEDEIEALELVERVLQDEGIPLVPGRTVEDIARRLHERAADRIEPPLPREAAELIEAYLAINGSPLDALDQVSALNPPGPAVARACEALARRCVLLSEYGVDPSELKFSAEFGRNLEYYTGHVFQIEVPHKDRMKQIVGGGRYDNLLSDIGAPEAVPAVGFAIHSERLVGVL
ncbi:MAG: ATP phosphoribosyltransferase regulatory subunit [Hyphomicrobiales bacterium]